MVSSWPEASQRRLGGWGSVFLVTTLATSVTGFGFPSPDLLPSHVVGILSLVILAGVVIALVKRVEGPWLRVYAAGVVAATYFNSFVLVVQLFRRLPDLNQLAPTQSEPPFAIAQALVLAIFVWLGAAADAGVRSATARR